MIAKKGKTGTGAVTMFPEGAPLAHGQIVIRIKVESKYLKELDPAAFNAFYKQLQGLIDQDPMVSPLITLIADEDLRHFLKEHELRMCGLYEEDCGTFKMKINTPHYILCIDTLMRGQIGGRLISMKDSTRKYQMKIDTFDRASREFIDYLRTGKSNTATPTDTKTIEDDSKATEEVRKYCLDKDWEFFMHVPAYHDQAYERLKNNYSGHEELFNRIVKELDIYIKGASSKAPLHELINLLVSVGNHAYRDKVVATLISILSQYRKDPALTKQILGQFEKTKLTFREIYQLEQLIDPVLITTSMYRGKQEKMYRDFKKYIDSTKKDVETEKKFDLVDLYCGKPEEARALAEVVNFTLECSVTSARLKKLEMFMVTTIKNISPISLAAFIMTLNEENIYFGQIYPTLEKRIKNISDSSLAQELREKFVLDTTVVKTYRGKYYFDLISYDKEEAPVKIYRRGALARNSYHDMFGYLVVLKRGVSTSKDSKYYYQEVEFANDRIVSGYIAQPIQVKHKGYTIPLRKDTSIQFSSSGSFMKGTLARIITMKIQDSVVRLGHPTNASRNQISFHPNGSIHTCFLADRSAQLSVGGKKLSFIQNATYKNEIAGYYSEVEDLRFNEKGAVTFGFLGEEYSFTFNKGFSIKNLPGTHADFYDNGVLHSCLIGKPTEINGVSFQKDSRVYVSEKGIIQGIKPSSLLEVGKIKFPYASIIALDEQGKILGAYLTFNQEIDGFCFSQHLGQYDKNYLITYYPNGSVRSGMPGNPQYGKQLYHTSYPVLMHNNGKVARGRLAENTAFSPYTFSGGTSIALSNTGKVLAGYFTTPTTIKNIVFKTGYEGYRDDLSNAMYFFNNDQVSSGQLANDTTLEIKGISYTFKAGTYMLFYETGEVAGGILATPVTVDGKSLMANKPVYFYKNGNLTSYYVQNKFRFKTIELYTDTRPFVQNKTGELVAGTVLSEAKVSFKNGTSIDLIADTTVQFHTNGTLLSGYLAHNAILYTGQSKNRVYCMKSTVSFYDPKKYPVQLFNDETLQRCTLASDQTIDGKVYTAGTNVIFWKNGTLRSVAPREQDHVIDDIRFKADEHLTFFDNEKVFQGILSGHTRIGNFKYEKGSLIIFYKNGKVRSGNTAEPITLNNMIISAGSNIILRKDGSIESFYANRIHHIIDKEGNITGMINPNLVPDNY